MLRRTTAARNAFPQILTPTSNQTFNLSSTAVLTCHVHDLGDHHVTWFKIDPSTSVSEPLAVGEQLFTTDKRYSVSSYSTSALDSVWSLEIYQLSLADEGTFLCKIANRRASVSIAIHLHVQSPMNLWPSYLYVEPGTHVRMNCTIMISHETSSLPPILWHFVSNQMNRTKPDDVHIRKRLMNSSLISFLIIHHARTVHSGIWTCAYKRQRRSARLIVDPGLASRSRHTHKSLFLLP